MAGKKQIEIMISADGEVSMDASGFKGGACEDAISHLHREIGKVTETKRKPEFYQKEIERVRHGSK